MKIKKSTVVLVVDAVEPSLDFWCRRLGFAVSMEVPSGEKLGFVALEKDGIEVMIQTKTSLQKDMAGAAKSGAAAFLYLEVEDLAAIIAKLDGIAVAVERRRAPYGADEIAYRDPGGHLVCFAERV